MRNGSIQVNILFITSIVDLNGNTRYYVGDDIPHRSDGPAYITPSGYCAWYFNGIRHRNNGPAVIWGDGFCEYWVNGVRYLPTDDGLPDINRRLSP